MNTYALILSFTLLVVALLGPVQAQIQVLRLNDVRIGMDKEVVLSGLGANYQLIAVPTAGVDGYRVASKDSKEEVKGQINFARGAVASVSEEIGGPYLDRQAIGVVRDLHRLLLSYGRRASDGKVRTSIQIEFDDQAMAGFGNAGRISFQVESGKQINVGFIVPDDPTSGSPAAYLSVFRNAR